MIRNFVAIVCGLIMGVLAVGIAESAGHIIFPPPPGIDIRNPESLAVIMESISVPAQLAILFAWGLGVFIGSGTALYISNGDMWPPVVVTGLLFLGSAWTMFQIPHPVWMVVGDMILTIAAVTLAIHLVTTQLTKRSKSEA